MFSPLESSLFSIDKNHYKKHKTNADYHETGKKLEDVTYTEHKIEL